MSDSIGLTIRNAWLVLPTWLRKFVIDAVEGSVAAVAILNLALPRDLNEAQSQAFLIAAAAASPVLAAARRDLLPAFINILQYLFPSPESIPTPPKP